MLLCILFHSTLGFIAHHFKQTLTHSLQYYTTQTHTHENTFTFRQFEKSLIAFIVGNQKKEISILNTAVYNDLDEIVMTT